MTAVIAINALVAGVLIWAVSEELRAEQNAERRQRWLSQNGARLAMQMYRYLFDGEPINATAISSPSAAFSLLHSVCSMASGYAPRRAQQMAQELELDEYVRQRTLYGPLCRRAVCAFEAAQATLEVDLHPTYPATTFGRVLTAVAVAQLVDERAVMRAVVHKGLNITMLSLVLELRSRRPGATDYRSALRSSESSVVRLGLAAVRRFRDERAVGDVLFLVDTRDDFLLLEALYTLAVLHAPLPRVSVSRAVSGLDVSARRRLYRLLVVEGYSASMLERLCEVESSPALCDFASGLCASYKRRLDTPTFSAV